MCMMSCDSLASSQRYIPTSHPNVPGNSHAYPVFLEILMHAQCPWEYSQCFWENLCNTRCPYTYAWPVFSEVPPVFLGIRMHFQCF